MRTPQSQLALQRVLDYLRLAGVELTPEVEQRALLLVSAALENAPEDLLAECMRRLPEVFELPGYKPMLQTPEIHRGSLVYGAY